MSYANERGLKPNLKKSIYQFKEKEIIDLVSDYVQKVTGLTLTYHVTESFDIGISTFQVRLDKMYFNDSYEMTKEQEYKLFEEWDMDLYYCDLVIAEIFDKETENIELYFNEYSGSYEVIVFD